VTATAVALGPTQQDLRVALTPLSDEQERALATLLPALVQRQPALLIGPAGAGKTYLLKRLLAEARLCGLRRILLVGPTWRALNVAVTAIGEPDLPHCTVAGLLRMKPAISSDTGKVVFRGNPDGGSTEDLAAHRHLRDGCDLVVTEEASMVRLQHARAVQRVARHLNAGILLVGDGAQLPPPGGGAVATSDDAISARAELTEVHRNGGEVLKLATRLRTHSSVRRQWPQESQLDPGGETGVIVHPSLEAWLQAAMAVLGTAAFDENPNRGRVLAWANTTADTVAAELRRRRYGAAADQWQCGEWLSAPNGLPTRGEAMGRQREPAATELQIISVSEPQRLVRTGPTFEWFTPAKNLPRELALSAEADVVELQVQRSPGAPIHAVYAEPPGQRSWSDQVKQLRAAVKDHLAGADRKKAMETLADFDACVPRLRPLMCMTTHSSQGGSFDEVFLHYDHHRCVGADARALAYVSASRARHKLHIIRSRFA